MFWMLFIIFSFFVGCSYVFEDATDSKKLYIHTLNVEQGLSVLLEYDGHFGLYDTGPDSLGFLDTLEKRGVTTLDWVILSHNHRDHIGGFLEYPQKLLDNKFPIKVKQLYVSRDTGGGYLRDSILFIAKRFEIPIDTLVRGDVLPICDGCEFSNNPSLRILWPVDYEVVEGNHSSLVANLEWNSVSLLLTGDLDSLGEKKLLELSPTLKTDLLQVAHHGSAGSSSLSFLAQVQPEYAFISVGKNNLYGHPTTPVLQKLKFVLGDTLRLFRTDLNGSFSFEISPNLGVIPID